MVKILIEEIAKTNITPKFKSNIMLLIPKGIIIYINKEIDKANIGENKYKNIFT